MEENDMDKIEKFLFLKNHKINKYILSNYFDEVKNGNKMNVLPNQIQKYITTINKGIDVLQREDFLDGFYNKFFYDNFSQNKHHHSQNNSKKRITNLPDIQFNKTKSRTRPKFGLSSIINKKFKTNYNVKNKKNNFLNKTFNKNKTKLDESNHFADLFSKDKKNNISRQSLLYPSNIISNTEDKNFFIKNQNLNYFSGFKTKYKGLMKKSKKYVIDINEYINGKGGSRNTKKNVLNKYKIKKIQTVLNQINKKIKNINQKEKMKDIIEDVKQYQQKEKDVKNKFRKTDEKFINLIEDSYNIQKRILKKFNTDYS